jgi:hypothetical protein
MNDLTHVFATRTVTGAEIADTARRFCGIHGQRHGRMTTPGEGLDTVGLIEAVAGCIGQRFHLDRDWPVRGGDLPLLEIPPEGATPGDVLEFDFSRAKGGRALGHQLAVLVHGASVLSKDARIVGVPHAVRLCWLDGLWRAHLVRAWRFGAGGAR